MEFDDPLKAALARLRSGRPDGYRNGLPFGQADANIFIFNFDGHRPSLLARLGLEAWVDVGVRDLDRPDRRGTLEIWEGKDAAVLTWLEKR